MIELLHYECEDVREEVTTFRRKDNLHDTAVCEFVERIIAIVNRNRARHLHHQVVTSAATPTAQPPIGGPR